MTREELELLKIEDCLNIVIPQTIFIPENESFSFDEAIEGTWYEKLVLPSGLEKPLLQDFENQFQIYKASLFDAIVEAERIEAEKKALWLSTQHFGEGTTQEQIDQAYANYVAEQIRLEAERIEAERIEAERIEAARIIEAQRQTILNEFRNLYAKDNGFPSLLKVLPEVSNPLLWANENKMTGQELTDLLVLVNGHESASDKVSQIDVLYKTMNEEVLNQMAAVFGTTNPDSASAYEGTYKLMLEKPSLFIGKLGLTSEGEVLAYAIGKMTAIENYAIWRLERIELFRVERESILNPQVI
jgi:hypothetical protein